MRKAPVLVLACALLTFCWALPLEAQVNSWLKPASGNWVENQWSLGSLPSAGQSILITNAGWKAVSITPNTLNYPDSLTVYSIILASPADSHNVLLLNYPGQAVPLTTRFFTVSSNSAVTMLNGALKLNGGSGEGMSVGGEFNQEDASTVLGSQMDVGYIGPGVYNLRSGTVWLQHVWVGGANGRMVQTGGTNAADIVHLEDGGRYELVDGDFNPRDVYFERGGVLRQTGGRINGGLAVYRGTYQLDGGVIYGGVSLPASDGFSSSGGNGGMVQSGGTNYGGVGVGNLGGYGSYVLSNGVSLGTSLTIGARGRAEQWSGIQTVTGTLSTVTDWIDRMVLGSGSYTLNGGSMSVGAGMAVGGNYTQNGGTNVVTGDITINGARADFKMSGGELRCLNVALMSSWTGGYTLSGGRHVVGGSFSIAGGDTFGFQGWNMSGGELVVSNLVLLPGAKFTKTGGTVAQSGTFTLTAANVFLGGGTHRFGRMELRSDDSGQRTNSNVYMPVGTNCVLAFGESRGITWSNNARVTIVNWTGNWAGGGGQQLYFGNSASGLSQEQVAQIIFQDPAGFGPGFYRAQLLQSGEIVPDALPPTGHIPPVVTLGPLNGGTMQIIVRGELMANYGIDVSTNLSDWSRWTTISTPQGTGWAIDAASLNLPLRYYRAVLLP